MPGSLTWPFMESRWEQIGNRFKMWKEEGKEGAGLGGPASERSQMWLISTCEGFGASPPPKTRPPNYLSGKFSLSRAGSKPEVILNTHCGNRQSRQQSQPPSWDSVCTQREAQLFGVGFSDRFSCFGEGELAENSHVGIRNRSHPFARESIYVLNSPFTVLLLNVLPLHFSPRPQDLTFLALDYSYNILLVPLHTTLLPITILHPIQIWKIPPTKSFPKPGPPFPGLIFQSTPALCSAEPQPWWKTQDPFFVRSLPRSPRRQPSWQQGNIRSLRQKSYVNSCLTTRFLLAEDCLLCYI